MRRRRVRVVVEQAGVAVGQELAAVVDEEERGVARDVRRAVRRVVHRDDERVRGEPVAGHRPGGPARTTPRSRRRRRRVRPRARPAATVTVADPVGRARRRRRAPAARSGCRSKSVQRHARQDVGRGPQVAAALDARADERGARGARPGTTGAKCRIATPETAAVRAAVIGPPSRIAVGTPVAASLRTTTALIAGSPSPLFVANPATHLMPSRSSPPSASGPRRCAGMAWANEPSGRGWTPIFGGSSASATSAIIVRSASARRSSIGGIAASDVRGGQVAERAADRASAIVTCGASLRGDDGLRCAGAPHRRRAEPRQPQAGTRRDRPVRRAGRRSRRTRAGPPRSSGSPATSAATPTSGRRSCASSAPTVPPPDGRACASGSSSWSPDCSGRARSRTWSRRSRATRRMPTTPRAPRPRSRRSPPTSASTP